MIKIKKFISTILATGLLLSMFAGCGGAGSNSETDQNVKETSSEEPIKIGVSAFPGWFMWYVAEGEGFFEKNGVNAELVWFPVYSDSLQAFNTGKVDMVCASLCDMIAPYEQGVDFRIPLITDNSDGGDGIVAANGIESVKDLKGKTVATEYGAIDHFFLLNALESNGMTEDDINFVNMTIQDAGPALISNTIDAACLLEPVISMATADGQHKLIYSTKETPGLIQDLTVVQTDVLNNRREDVKKIIKSFFDSVDFYNSNPDKAYEDIMDVAGVTKEEMPGVMAGAKIFNIDDNIDSMTVEKESNLYLPYIGQKNAEYLKSVDMISGDYTKDDIKKLIDSSIVEELAKEKK